MKNCSFKWLLSTMLLITTTFLTSTTATSKSPTPTSPEVKTLPDDSNLQISTIQQEMQPVIIQMTITRENRETQFAEASARTKMPKIYAKKIYTGTGKDFKAATGNYRGNAYHRMM